MLIKNLGMRKFLIRLLLVSFATIIYSNCSWAAYLRDVPQTIKQPDGTIINCFASGDEYLNWLHDSEGRIITKNDKGYYVYAIKDSVRNTKQAQSYAWSLVVGKSNLSNTEILKNIAKSPQEILSILSKKHFRVRMNNKDSQPAASTGQLNNLVVFIRFADENEFTEQKTFFDDMFNASNKSSLKSYYNDAAYGKLNIDTFFYPNSSNSTVASYQDSHDRSYFQPYDQMTNPNGYKDDLERTQREHSLLRDAINSISAQVPVNLNLDNDNDGEVDNVCFIVSGMPDGWSSLLWPHKWALYSYNVTLNGKRVFTFNLQLGEYLHMRSVGVLCHEMFHSLGAPDLYHYYSTGDPVGPWDLMERDLDPPQHMSAYMKYRYGKWIDEIPVITKSGTYTLNPLASNTNQVYKIPSSSSSEYMVLEYRKKEGMFESSLPGSGLLVYRINDDYNGEGNADSGSQAEDEVYLYRPNGTTIAWGTIGTANFSANVNRTTIGENTNPKMFLSDGTWASVAINNIGSAGNNISFEVALGNTPVVTSVSSSKPNGKYGVNEVIPILVRLNKPVYVQGAPRLLLETGGVDKYAIYQSGNGTQTLMFNYVVEEGDAAADLDYVSVNALELNAGTIKDNNGNDAEITLPQPGTANSLSANQNIEIDGTPPTVTISQADGQLDPSNANSLSFKAIFSEKVTDFRSEDVLVSGTAGAVSAVVSNLSADGMNFKITVSDMKYDGTVIINIPSGSAIDLTGNKNKASQNIDNVITYDAPPFIEIVGPNPIETSKGPVNYIINYSDVENITLSSSDISLNTTGTAFCDITVSGTGKLSRNLQLSNISGDGTIAFSVAPDTAVDKSGNLARAINSSPSFKVDNTAPIVADVNSDNTSGLYRIADVVVIKVKSNEVLTVNTSGGIPELMLDINGIQKPAKYIGGSGSDTLEFSYVVEPGDYAESLDYAAEDALKLKGSVISDAVGNQFDLNLPIPGSAGSLSANKYLHIDTDITPPAITISSPSKTITRSTAITYTVNYDGATNISLANSYISLMKTGSANGVISVSGSGKESRIVTVSNITGDGSLAISIAAASASDQVDNKSAGTGTSQSFAVDNTGPSITIAQPSTDKTAKGPVSFKVTSADAASMSLLTKLVKLTKGGSATAVLSISGSGNNERTITLSNFSGTGTVQINVLNGFALDELGNPSTSSPLSQQIEVDNTPPLVKISSPSEAISNDKPVSYNVDFIDADNITLSTAKLTLNTTGTASGDILIEGTGSSRKVTVENVEGYGTIGITVKENSASDSLGNKSTPVSSARFWADGGTGNVKITTPSDKPEFNKTIVNNFVLGGIITGKVSKVSWNNLTTKKKGSAKITGTNWTAANIILKAGINQIVVKGLNGSKKAGEDTIFVNYEDTTPPVINITSPSKTGAYTTKKSTIIVSGTAIDNEGIASIDWVNTTTKASGKCSKSKKWKSSKINLSLAENNLQFIVTDTSGNKSKVLITIRREL